MRKGTLKLKHVRYIQVFMHVEMITNSKKEHVHTAALINGEATLPTNQEGENERAMLSIGYQSSYMITSNRARDKKGQSRLDECKCKTMSKKKAQVWILAQLDKLRRRRWSTMLTHV